MGTSNICRLLTSASGTTVPDPGSGGTINVYETLRVTEIVTAAAEARTLPAPLTIGMVHTLYLKTDGGNATITVTGGYDQAGSTTLTFSDAGDFALLQSINDNGTLRWQMIHYVSGSEVVSTETIQYADNVALQFGTGSDISLAWDGTRFELLPVSDDTGAVNIGDGTTDMDFKVFLGATTAYVECNVGDGQINIEGAELHFGDNDKVEFGDAAGGDFTIAFDATQLEILPTTDDTGAVNIGDGTTDADFKVFLGATTAYLEANVGDGQVNIEGAELHLGDSDEIEFGDSNDVIVQWDGTRLSSNAAANAMWDSCPSKLNPNYLSDAFDVEDDFYEIDTTATVGKWAAAAVGTGTTTIDDDVAGGVLLLTCQATTDDACEQLTLVSAPFYLAAGKDLWYETRLKIVGDAQSEVAFGLCALGEDLTAVADVLAADGVSFSSQDATLALDLTASKDGTDTGAVAAVHTMVSGTYATYGFKISGVTSVTPYIDTVAGTAATATIPDDESLCPFFLVRNGDGTTQQILHVDYVRVVQLR